MAAILDCGSERFELFCSTRHPDAFYQVSSQFAFWFRSELDFQDSSHGGHLGFPIRTILAILMYKSPHCFLLNFKSICLSVHGVHVCWSEHSDSSFVYRFMSGLRLGFHDHYYSSGIRTGDLVIRSRER